MPNSTPQKRPKRLVTVDGIRYSLDTGDSVGPAPHRPAQLHPVSVSTTQSKPVTPASPPEKKPSLRRPRRNVRVPEQPLPAAVKLTSHNQAVMHPDPKLRTAQLLHPHNVSHPALPLPTSRQRPSAKLSIWQSVVKPSLTETHDRRTVWASIGIALLSPITWLLLALPAVVIFAADVRRESVGKIFASTSSWILAQTPTSILTWLAIFSVLLGIVWLARHSLVLVAYGVQVRRIDNRLVSGHQLWWQTLAKISRLVLVALVDGLMVVTVCMLAGLALQWILGSATQNMAVWWSLFFNLTVFMLVALLWLLATHRPLTRVMLSITNRPASFLVVKGFGLIFRNWIRALGLGFVWLAAAGLTAFLLAGISWATIIYGLVQITTSIGRVALWAVSGSLLIFILTSFTVWSNGYWPRAYHMLAHRAYPRTVSRFMADDPRVKSRLKTILHVSLIVIAYLLIVTALLWYVRPSITQRLDTVQQNVPETLDKLLPKLQSR